MDDATLLEADPKRPWKAVAATVLSFVAAFVTFWVADVDPFTAKDAGQAALSGLIASGLIGGATYGVRNPQVPAIRGVRNPQVHP